MFFRLVPSMIINNYIRLSNNLIIKRNKFLTHQEEWILNLNNKKNKIYTPNEEWILDKICSTEIGITNKAIEELGELVYIDFTNKKGDIIKENDELVNIESVKASESINAPYDCILLENNYILEQNLESINKNPEDTWIIKIDKLN